MSTAKKNIIQIHSSSGKSVTTSLEDIKEAAEKVKRFDMESELSASLDKQFTESKEVQEIAKQVMADKGFDLSPARISYLLVYPNISKKRPAKAKKAIPELTHFAGIDYLLEISGEVWDMLDSDTKYNLVWHQLLHFDPKFNPKSGSWKFNMRKPEYSDYYQIHNEVGADWHETVQAVTSSLYDLDPRDENQVSMF